MITMRESKKKVDTTNLWRNTLPRWWHQINRFEHRMQQVKNTITSEMLETETKFIQMNCKKHSLLAKLTEKHRNKQN